MAVVKPVTCFCTFCDRGFTWHPRHDGTGRLTGAFSVQGEPGVIYWENCRGHMDDGVFIPDAFACPDCSRPTLSVDAASVAQAAGWIPPAEPAAILRQMADRLDSVPGGIRKAVEAAGFEVRGHD